MVAVYWNRSADMFSIYSLTNDSEADSDDCDYAVYEYLWLNNLHPTYPIHNLLAKEVAALLVAGPTF